MVATTMLIKMICCCDSDGRGGGAVGDDGVSVMAVDITVA
jgi:hypothetical protein